MLIRLKRRAAARSFFGVLMPRVGFLVDRGRAIARSRKSWFRLLRIFPTTGNRGQPLSSGSTGQVVPITGLHVEKSGVSTRPASRIGLVPRGDRDYAVTCGGQGT